eukprot:gene5379-5614_t
MSQTVYRECWGVIDDLAVLKGRGGSSGQKDSLVLAARDAKIAVVEWDEQQHCLRNSSLHSFEGDPALREGCPIGTSLTGLASSLVGPAPRVVTDPGGRCAAALVYGKQLALLPAIQTDVLEQLLQEASTVQSKTSSASVGNSYVVNLAKAQGVKLSSTTAVRSWTFLHGYTEPVLLLLYEATPTWGARLRDSRDTCALAALSINLRKKRHPTIWSVHQLPSDSSRVMAVPRGGVLVLSQNLLLYYAQGGSCVMAINSNAFAGALPGRLAWSLRLTGPWAAGWLVGNVALLSLKTGQLLLVALKFEGSAASKMQVMVAGSSPVASCMTSFTPHLLFLGSQAGDGLLVRHTAAAAVPGAPSSFKPALSGALSSFGSLGVAAGAGSSLGGEQAAKRRRLMSLASFDMGGGREGDPEALGAANMSGSGAGAGDGAGEARSRLLEDEGDIYRSAIGRSQSAVLPTLLGAELKQQLKVLDSLMCLAPMRCSVVADLHLRESDLHSLISDDQSERDSVDARASSCLIAAVGSEKSGGLALMRRSVPADVVTAVPDLGAHGAWTLHYRAPKVDPGSQDDAGSVPSGDAAANDGPGLGSQTAESKEQPTNMSEDHHAFLLLSCGGNSTMVLDARGKDMAELTEQLMLNAAALAARVANPVLLALLAQVGYLRDVPTLAAGPAFKATAAVQVSHSAVRVVQGSSTVLQHITVQQLLQDSSHPSTAGTADLDVCIRFAQVRDPYVLLLLSDFTVLLLQEDEQQQQQQLRLLRAALPDPGWSDELAVATAACLYTDSTGWLEAAAGLKTTSDSRKGQAAAAEDTQDAAADAADMVDDDHDGLAQPAVEAAGTEQGLQQQQALGTAGVEDAGEAGQMAVKVQPSTDDKAPSEADHAGDAAADSAAGAPADVNQAAGASKAVEEDAEQLDAAAAASHGDKSNDDEADEDGDGDADMSLNPSPVSEVMMECFAGASGGALGAPAAAAPLLVMLRDSGECLVYKAFKPPGVSCPVGFRRQPVDAVILGRESPAPPAAADGKLSIGNQTYTIGGVVAHPMQQADVGRVDAFCDFHNVNCPHGYIAAAREGQLNICTLPLQLRLDQPWLTTKLPLRATPHGLAWYPEARLLAVTTSRLAAPPRPLLPADPVAAAAGWAGLAMWRYSLLPGETAMALKPVQLSEGSAAGTDGGGAGDVQLQPFLAVGCASSFGEDYPALGRVLLFQALQKEVAGPVTAIESLRGFLIIAVGNKVEMHYKQGNTLVKVNFLDIPQMVSSLACVKDYLLLGQLGHSLAFLRYHLQQEKGSTDKNHQLVLVSQDYDKLEAWAVEFMPNATKLSQVMADGGGNLTVLVYDRKDLESRQGDYLLRRGAAHVGAWVSQFQRMKLSVPGEKLNRQGLLGLTAEGSLLLLSPFWDEAMFKRMASLQQEMVYCLQHTAGLNPKAFQGRFARVGPAYGAGLSAIKPLKMSENTLLQGDLLWAYAGLDVKAQVVIANAVGNDVDTLLQDLRLMTLAADFL